jgi:hypothetical protein
LPVLDATLPDDPRVRDLRVTPHALDRYDELYAVEPSETAPIVGKTHDDDEATS